MKKSIFIISLLLLFCTGQTYAQFGVRTGINISKFHIAEEVDYFELNSIIGLNLGALYEMQISDKFSIQGEVHFIQKGGIGKDLEYDEEITIRINYVDLNVMAKFNLAKLGENGSFYISATPYTAFALSGTNKNEYMGESETIKIDFEEDNIRRIDYGMGFGLGVRWNRFFVDTRYNIGLLNLDKIADDYDEEKIYNRGILIGIGYQFN